MSLEQMTKADLVKQLRETIQANKELESQMKEIQEDKVTGNVAGELELPYIGVSLLRGKGHYYIVKLAYDIKGNAKVVSREKRNTDYNAYYDAEIFLNTVIDRQEAMEEDLGVLNANQ